MSVSAGADTPVIALDSVVKLYRQRRPGKFLRPVMTDVRALDGVSISVDAGSVVAYAGPNGAGKSTTIKLLCGMLHPTEGSVRVFGLDPARHRVDVVRRLGVVFGQRTELWWDQPVSASFDWKRVVWDVPRARYDRTRDELVELLGVDELWDVLARELSLGRRMRADLALALVHEPEVLVLDEPTLGLDVLAKRTMLDLLRRLNATKGTTVLVTSHDMADLEQLAARIIMIDHGRMAFDGSFEDLRRLVPDRRSLVIDIDGTAPVLSDARHVESNGSRHTYEFDAVRTRVADLLSAAGPSVRDVETSRLPMDDVIADLYEKWMAARE